jgi:hypothetical protein
MATITGQTITQLILSVNEKDVENSYRQYFTRKFSDMIFTSPFSCDGLGESKSQKIRVLTEFKDELNLLSKSDQIKVLAQIVYYIKKFELAGIMLPTTVFVGDRNECFVIHSNDLFKYLSMDLDWSIAPSNAHKNLVLVNEMMLDENINPHIFSIHNIDECIGKLKDLTNGVTRLIPITPHNITEVFSYFEKNVLGKHNLNTNKLANLFVQILINPDDNYLHPVKKRKTIVTKSFNEVPLKTRESFTSFFNHFSNDYTPRQKEDLTAVVDRLIQDVTRRKQGEFFTPTIWVDKAHEYIASVYGDDWKEKYIVWDPAWGTGNLTRDYKFKELYVSTLNYSDIQTAEQMGYNPEAFKFQFDFLNDDYDFLPKGLRDAIESGKEIIVLMNPPYASSANFGETDKKYVSKTKQNVLMLSEGWGKSAQNIYAQFLYGVCKLKEKNDNINLCFFSPSLFLTGTSFKEFRHNFNKHFYFEKGFLFKANHFSDVAKDWGVNFICFGNNKNENRIVLDLLDFDGNFQLITEGTKELYNLDNTKPASIWVREEVKKMKTNSNIPQMQNSLVVYSGKDMRGSYVENSLGYLLNGANSVDKNSQQVAFWGIGFYNGNGLSVIPENFNKCVSLFTARKIINKDWINSKDEYLTPNENHEQYNQFTYDSVVTSLFHIHAYQSSLRQVTYKDQLWDIKNEFFWLSKEEMMNLANDINYTELYNDARTDNNRYVHNLLFGEQNIYEQLSSDAKLVLDKATELVRMSMTMRSHFADDHNHLNSWDAGYAQLKLVWKEYFPEEFKEFRQLYKNLEDRMRPLVYELGFLLK